MARKENTDVDNGVSENEIETYFIRGREFSTARYQLRSPLRRSNSDSSLVSHLKHLDGSLGSDLPHSLSSGLPHSFCFDLPHSLGYVVFILSISAALLSDPQHNRLN
ncbi:hypothetical protein WN943_003592 [Citrus x changshan-huyou]